MSQNDGKLTLRVEIDRETDGRWIADIPELPGVAAYLWAGANGGRGQGGGSRAQGLGRQSRGGSI